MLLALLASVASAAELNVQITGIANTGPIHVLVFTSAQGFPKEDSAAVHVKHPDPGKAQLDLAIQVPEAADYALMAYQDKNGDGRMNRLFGMIPQEPYALSRNPEVLGKPNFADSAVPAANRGAILLKLRD